MKDFRVLVSGGASAFTIINLTKDMWKQRKPESTNSEKLHVE
jgi:hypothetical protein